MFIDEIKVFASAGHGGKGCVAFQREAYRPKGGPSGGNGGRGGNVILEASHDLNNLIAQFYEPRLIAQPGEAGMGKGMDGSAGRDRVIKVPCGTLVWRLPDEGPVGRAHLEARTAVLSNEGERAFEIDPEEGRHTGGRSDRATSKVGAELVVDLTAHGQQWILCRGGRGGLGNRNFATAARQTPRFAQPGESGEEGWFLFELRIMAEVGLVGYPNAGKSTLLAAISQARPKVAAYPFTTLDPQIGIVEYDDYHRLTVCDVPGLIEGAHQNVGLGHLFLRHIERCRVIAIILDMAGTDGRMPWEDYRSLLRELELYNPELLERPRLVVANKMDEPVAAELLRKFKRKIAKTPVLGMAAGFGEGLEAFRKAIRQKAGG